MTNGIVSSAFVPHESSTVVCVVLNWNGCRDTISCLQSLAEQDYPALQIVVVDNNSTDDSVAHIREAFPSVEMLQSPANHGFAAGCNLGTRLALERSAAFVWLLNNDTVVPPDTLTKLIAAASDSQTGMVGTVLRYAHNPAKVQAWGGGSIVRSMGFARHFYAPAALDSNSYLTFASVLLRRELLQGVGLLDEGYFMYFEDADLSFRARAAGWRLAVAADTAVLHKEGGSVSPNRNSRVDRIVTASGIRFLRRYGQPQSIAPILFVLSRLGKRLLHADLAGIRAVLRGVLDWWRDTPMAFQKES
jgi:GT2 family glycosyltransferase